MFVKSEKYLYEKNILNFNCKENRCYNLAKLNHTMRPNVSVYLNFITSS